MLRGFVGPQRQGAGSEAAGRRERVGADARDAGEGSARNVKVPKKRCLKKLGYPPDSVTISHATQTFKEGSRALNYPSPDHASDLINIKSPWPATDNYNEDNHKAPF